MYVDARAGVSHLPLLLQFVKRKSIMIPSVNTDTPYVWKVSEGGEKVGK